MQRHGPPNLIPLLFRHAGQNDAFSLSRQHAFADDFKARIRLSHFNAVRGFRYLRKVRHFFQRNNQRRNTLFAVRPLPHGRMRETTFGIHFGQFKLPDLHCGFIFAKAHVQHSVIHGSSSLAESAGRYMRIGHVQAGVLSRLRIRHAHHTPQKLLHVYAGTNIGHGTEHIGKGAIPAFFQGFHGNHIFHRAVAAENIQRIQFPLFPCGHGNFRRRDIMIQKKLLQSVHRAILVFFLSLEQYQRPDVLFILGGEFGQRFPCLHRPQHGFFP